MGHSVFIVKYCCDGVCEKRFTCRLCLVTRRIRGTVNIPRVKLGGIFLCSLDSRNEAIGFDGDSVNLAAQLFGMWCEFFGSL